MGAKKLSFCIQITLFDSTASIEILLCAAIISIECIFADTSKNGTIEGNIYLGVYGLYQLLAALHNCAATYYEFVIDENLNSIQITSS